MIIKNKSYKVVGYCEKNSIFNSRKELIGYLTDNQILNIDGLVLGYVIGADIYSSFFTWKGKLTNGCIFNSELKEIGYYEGDNLNLMGAGAYLLFYL